MSETTLAPGPVLFAYDGSELAGYAIQHAATQLAKTRALVVTVWQPVDLGFTPLDGYHLDAGRALDVRAAAEAVAAHGAELAAAAGLSATALAVEASPVWQGLVQTVDEHGATVVVLGAHRHGALAARLFGHVTADLLSHSSASLLVVGAPNNPARSSE